MATIKAVWRRTVQTKQFEPETLELSVEKNHESAHGDPVKAVADLERELSAAGDALLVERMDDRLRAQVKAPSPSRSQSHKPTEPDPFVS